MQLSGAINVATDVVLLIIPLPLLPLLKFNRRQRSKLYQYTMFIMVLTFI